MRSRAKATLFLLLGLLLLGGMLAYVGPGEVVRALSAASPLYLGLSLVAYMLFFLFRGWRWKLLFSYSAPDVRVSSTTAITAVGWLANSILPLKGGDVLRAALVHRRERVGLATSAATVGLERVLDLVGLALLAAAGLLVLPRAAALPAGLEKALAIVWILPLAALATLAILVRWRKQTVALATRVMRPFGKLGAKLVDFGDTVLAGLHALAQRPALLVKLAPLTLVIATLQALVFTFLVMAFLGTPMLLAFAGSAVFLLSFVVSITPGNVGTYEAAFAAVFVSLGVAPEAAVPAAILTHVTTTLTVAVLGGLGMFALGADKAALPWTAARPVPKTLQGGAP